MAQKLFYFPQPDSGGKYQNPYSYNFKHGLQQFFDVVDSEKSQTKLKSLGLLTHSAAAHIYILNWVESIPHLRFSLFQTMIVLFSLKIMKLRNSEIVWMFHNIRPHQGENWKTRLISDWLFENASLIISHSREAANYAKKKAKCKVIYRCHPVTEIKLAEVSLKDPFDVFIWGSIYPYKGIMEFLSNPVISQLNLKIKIIGQCTDKTLDAQIRSYVKGHVIYENRKADYSEIAANCKSAKFVLFTYVGKCVSSSGALIDTIVMGGIPVGPKIGAFDDLSKDGVCLVYSDTEELVRILKGNNSTFSEIKRKTFISDNSWENFIENLSTVL